MIEEGNEVRITDTGERKIKIRELNKVSLKEGDILVLRFPQRLSSDDQERLRAMVEVAMLAPLGLDKSVKVFVLDNGADLCVLERKIPGGKLKEGGDRD